MQFPERAVGLFWVHEPGIASMIDISPCPRLEDCRAYSACGINRCKEYGKTTTRPDEVRQ